MSTLSQLSGALVIVALCVTGCANDEPGPTRSPSDVPEMTSQSASQPTPVMTSSPTDESPDAAAAVEQMTVVPDPAPLGAVVELQFPEGALRGVGFEFQRNVEGGWERTHWMISDGNDPDEMKTFPAVDDGLGTIDVGFEAAGSERVVLPEDVPPGKYRVCAWNIGEERCAEFGIEG